MESTSKFPIHGSAEPRLHSGGVDLQVRAGGNLDSLFDSWFLIKRRWLLITLVTVLAFAWVFVMTKLVLTKWYQATALLRPLPAQMEANDMSSIASQVIGGSGGLGSMLSSMGMDTQIQDEAEADMSILQSFAFTMALLKRHRLIPTIASESRGPLDFGTEEITPWKLYQAMDQRFDCTFDIETGNITLTFLAPSRAEAERLLNFYIDDLREKLRIQQIGKAALAIDSLNYQAAHTSDALLQQDLYDLLAKQVQRQELAKVQADFAFSVIDPPVVPDKPHKPKVVLSSVVAAALALFGCVGAILLRERLSRSLEEYHRRGRAMAQTADELPLKKPEETTYMPRRQSL